MKTTLSPKQKSYHRSLVIKFHTLIGKMPNPVQAKEEILLSYNAASTNDLSIEALKHTCDALAGRVDPKAHDLDVWRKRLMAAIGGWLRAMNKVESIGLIKGIACRASGKTEFNKIPMEQLRSLYNAFRNKAKDVQSVDDLTKIELDYLSISN